MQFNRLEKIQVSLWLGKDKNKPGVEFCLSNYNTRYYDAVIRKFISPD